jgi:ATP-dependent Zn protease
MDQLMPNGQRAPRVKAPNGFHEAGHAVFGWALGLHVIEITMLDHGSGESAKIDGADGLPLVDRLAIYQASQAAEEILGYLMPASALRHDHRCIVNLISARGIRNRLEIARRIDDGRNQARGLLKQHGDRIHKIAAHLSRLRRLNAHEFKSLMEAAR